MLLKAPIIFKAKKPTTMAPIVILHGLLGRARNMRSIAEGLSDLADVYAFDLRGHGESDHQSGMGIYDMAVDVVHTCRDMGLGAVNILGHSLGGKIGMAICLSDLYVHLPVLDLIVADIAPAPAHHGHGALIDSLLEKPLPDFERASQATTYIEGIVKDRDLAAWLAQNIEPGKPSTWSCDIQSIRSGLHDMELWPVDDILYVNEDSRWNGNAMFIHGANSPYVTEQEKKQIRHYFSRAEIITVADAGHWLHIEQKEEFLKQVRNFLIKHCA